jgi:hypothetical protein
MKIITGPGKKNESRFSIDDVRPVFSGTVHDGTAHSYLSVSLKPSIQERARGFGSSFEAKGYPAELEISFDELQKMVAGITSELNVCYQVLHEHELLGSIAEARKRNQEVAIASSGKRQETKVLPRRR